MPSAKKSKMKYTVKLHRGMQKRFNILVLLEPSPIPNTTWKVIHVKSLILITCDKLF
jgi:hypothetical protein